MITETFFTPYGSIVISKGWNSAAQICNDTKHSLKGYEQEISKMLESSYYMDMFTMTGQCVKFN